MNNEKLPRDQKGENSQYIKASPSWKRRLPGQENRVSSTKVRRCYKPTSTGHPPSTWQIPGPVGFPHGTAFVMPWPLTHAVPFAWISYPPLFTQLTPSGTQFRQKPHRVLDLQTTPHPPLHLPLHLRGILCLQSFRPFKTTFWSHQKIASTVY